MMSPPKLFPNTGLKVSLGNPRNWRLLKQESHLPKNLVQAQTQQLAPNGFWMVPQEAQVGGTKGTHLIPYIKVSLKSSPRQKTLAGHKE